MSNPLDALSPDIRNRILNYQPKLLEPGDAAAVLPQLRDLVASVPPGSSDAARQYMSSACRFLADTSTGRTCSLDLLIDVELARWVSLAEAGGMPTKTLKGHVSRLKALLRVRRGLPGHLALKGKTPAHEPPYSAAEVAAILHEVSDLGGGAQAVVIAVLGTGVILADAVGGRLHPEDGGLFFVTTAGNKKPVVTPVAARVGDPRPSTVAAKQDWVAARAAVSEAGVALDMRRGLQTYRVAVLSDGRPVGTALAEFPLGDKALEAARPYLPDVDAVAAQALLRG